MHLPSGRVRQYSLCGDPAVTDAYRIAVRRIPGGGGGSLEVHDEVAVGSTLTTSGPRNAFPLAVPGYGSPTQRFRFIAGGIGITPILPMLAQAERLGVDWSMIYAGRSRDSLPFLDELARFGDRIDIRTDDESGLPSAAELLGGCPDGTTVYACGPAPALTAIRAELAGRDDVELHFERFAAAPVVDGHAFTVSIASSGTSLRVRGRGDAADSAEQGWRARPVLVPAGLLRNVSRPGSVRVHRAPRHSAHRPRAGRGDDARLRLACIRRHGAHPRSVSSRARD